MITRQQMGALLFWTGYVMAIVTGILQMAGVA